MDIQQPATLVESRKAPIVVGSGDWLAAAALSNDESAALIHKVLHRQMVMDLIGFWIMIGLLAVFIIAAIITWWKNRGS